MKRQAKEIRQEEEGSILNPDSIRTYYSSEEFNRTYFYSGNDLGATCREEETQFKLWSPLAKKVVLFLYEDGDKSTSYQSWNLTLGKNGVWEIILPKRLHGIYYDYEIHIENKINRTADPYAIGCGVNGKRSMVVDLKETNPCGWEEDKAPKKSVEDIIYELHVKEFSWAKSGGFSEEWRGMYKAFLQADTTWNQDGCHPTGIAYLKELGVTHIQLMPIYDYGSVDEAGDKNQFNWGYDPMNYNVPEGSYSTDPFHGEVRIRELKEMILSLHKHGFRVIMDVVYNHTYSADSWLNRTVPEYYYRYKKNGTLANGSGCGNDIKSERPMCSKYILDSVLYWAEEYHIDGFRFDLMGLLDVALINTIQKELDSRFGIGEKLIYGEPWAAGKSPMESGSIPALKKYIRKLDENVGMFCDSTRDAIKGHVFEEEQAGFVNGGKGFEQDILYSVAGWCDKEWNVHAKAPSQIITYISAHDNLTLWDKLVLSMTEKKEFHSMEEKIVSAYKLAAAIYFTCQGRLFLLSGEEFARTKEGIENSYCSSIEINRLDWNRAYENQEIVSYYKGLIGLRKQLFGLCDKSGQAMKRIHTRKIEGEGCVSFCFDNKIVDEAKSDFDDKDIELHQVWEEVFVAYNAKDTAKIIKLPKGKWTILLDKEKSDYWKQEKQRTIIENEIEVKAISAIVLGRIKMIE